MEDWKEVKLGDIAVLNYGKALRQIDRKEGNIPVYSSAGLTGFHNKPMVDSKGIIIGRKGTIGKIFKTEVPFCCIDTAYYIIPNDEKYNFDFFFYRLKTLNLEELNSDSAVPGLNRNIAYDQKLLLPPLPEQRAIAAVLSSLDDKIDLLHRQNETLEAMAETLFREWFIEQADEDWEEGTLGDEFEIIMGQSPPGSSYNEEGIGTPMYQGNRDFGFRFPTNRVFTVQPKRFAQKYDTLISVRAPVGAQNMANEVCCIGRGVSAFRYKNDPGNYTYTFYKLKSLMNEIKQYNQTGTVFGSISKTDFQQMKVLVPKEEDIQVFQNIAKPIDKRINNNSEQIRTLTQLRDTLLPKLMSGEIRVKETEVITD